MVRFGGHSADVPPKRCSVCRMPLRTPKGVKWADREAHRCQCERCIHNLFEYDRRPWVCEACANRPVKRPGAAGEGEL